MKHIKLILFIFLLGKLGELKSQSYIPQPKEYSCFQYFDYDETGRSDINAYLLGMLARLTYPQYLVKDIITYTENELHSDDNKFEAVFKVRTAHMFTRYASLHTQNSRVSTFDTSILRIDTSILIPGLPTLPIDFARYKFIAKSDRSGLDPEAMVISTNNYILVLFRGTDRVGSTPAGSTAYEWGEWITTDANVTLSAPCNNCAGRAHSGFRNSLDFSAFYTELVQKIREFNGVNKKIWIVGHSLGGAQAQIFAYRLKKMENIMPQGVYCYNSPKAGDARFTQELETILPAGRLQRFEFKDDPVASIPPQPQFNEYEYAGIRNYYDHLNGNNNYFYNCNERTVLEQQQAYQMLLGAASFGGACFHHPTWLVNATYLQLTEQEKSKLPNPPPNITIHDEACNICDINNGMYGNCIGAPMDISEGVYRFKNVRNGKYLNVNSGCRDNGCKAELYSQSHGWLVKEVPGALLPSYTISFENASNVLDADRANTNTDNCKVQVWERNLSLVLDRRQQEWQVKRLSNGNYKIICVKDGLFLDLKEANCNTNGCDVVLKHEQNSQSQEWILERTVQTNVSIIGTYYIKSVGCTNKYLNVDWNRADINSSCHELNIGGIGNTDINNKFIIEAVNGTLGGYTIKSMYDNRYLDADVGSSFSDALASGAHVNNCDRRFITVPRKNQEWKFDKLPDGSYIIYPVANENLTLDAMNNCNNGAHLRVYERNISDGTQRWFFNRAN